MGKLLLRVAFFGLPFQWVDCFPSYSEAWRLRISHGHMSAQPWFQALLESHPTDLTASTRIAASSRRLLRNFRNACTLKDTGKLKDIRNAFISHNFFNTEVAKALNMPDWKAATPIFVKAATVGRVRDHLPFHDCSMLEILISLFILGLTVPSSFVPKDSQKTIDLFLSVGLLDYCEIHQDILVPLVAITPMDPSLYFVTDWHPHVLGLVQIDEVQHPVMYIGPDSLALTSLWQPRFCGELLDLCTGCGVQGLYQVATGKCTHANLVDVNPRAVRFAEFNAALNGLSEHITVQQCDLRNLELSIMIEIWRGVDIVVANPPFLPIPEGDHRHGLYSAGGPSGDRLLFKALDIAEALGAKETAIVSEFFFDEKENNLVRRIQEHWTGRGLLLTNECPIDAKEYANRRADSSEETELWLQHLTYLNIQRCSPGLLLLEQTADEGEVQLVHVPRSDLGSIWTPGNYLAEQFCKSEARRFFNYS